MWTASAGQHVGDYILAESLGEGGYGAVWSAQDPRQGRLVAMKFLKDAGGGAGQRFEREARVLQRIQHPNCVRFLDAGTHESGQPYLVMEYLHGPTLDQWLQTTRPHPELVAVAIQLSDALAAAHRLKIVHRDLKPSNIIVLKTPNGPMVKILDFGIAKLTGRRRGDVTKTGEVIGTPGFMSPEQLRGHDPGPPSDVYCLGIILFTMFNGIPPFQGATPLEISMSHLMDALPSPRTDVPPHIVQLLGVMLAKDPSRRPTAAMVSLRLQGRAVRTAQSESPTSAVPVAAVVGLGAALLVAVAIWFISSSDSTPPPRVERVAAVTTANSPPKLVHPNAPEHVLIRDACGRRWTPGEIEVVGGNPGVPVYVPKTFEVGAELGLIVLFHEGGQKPSGIFEEANLFELANEEGFLLAAPPVGEVDIVADTNVNEFLANVGDGPKDKPSIWPKVIGPKVRDELELLKRNFCVAPDKVFFLGHGRGARSVQHAACDNVPMAGAMMWSFRLRTNQQYCRGQASTPLLNISPIHDSRDPVEGDFEGDYQVQSLDDYEQGFADHNGCTERGEVDERGCTRWKCETEFVSCRIDGGRHAPGHHGYEPDTPMDHAAFAEIIRSFVVRDTAPD